jgi:TonB family protein
MRVLVVDQDSTLLTEIAQMLGEYFTIDAVTTKGDCLDLVRSNEFEVIVAGERLEDGSGLELLGQLARSRPDMLRIFAAERERLRLLKGRLGPFGLFRTLSYPIEPRQLLAALSAAAGIEVQIDADEADAPAEAPDSAPVAAIEPAAPPAPRPRPQTASQAPARKPHTGVARQANTFNAPRRGARQPSAEALAAANRLEIVSRSKAPPMPTESSPARSAFMVAAGVVLVLGGLWLFFKIFNTRDESVAPRIAPAHTTGYPPEVVKLVADTETAFQQDDLKTARTDVAALQQIAPDHPRLSFFESLLKKLEASTRDSSRRLFQRHTSAPDRLNHNTSPEAATSDTLPVRQRPGAAPGAAFGGSTLEDDTSSASAPQPTTSLKPGATLPSATATTREAKLLQRVAPEYPPEAERRGVEGSVDVSFTIDPEGKVTDVIVDHSEPSEIFDRAAASAVRRWRYEPKVMDGTPVEQHTQAHLVFKLDSNSH